MRYRIILPKSVQKELDRLPEDAVRRILARLAQLETNPRPTDVKKLKGRKAWRIRVGDYRGAPSARFINRNAVAADRLQSHTRIRPQPR